MRKILIIVLIAIMLFVGYLAIFNGIKVLGIEIPSIIEIKEKNEELDVLLQRLSTLTSADYPKAISSLKDNYKQLLLQKENYNDMVINSSESDITKASEFEKHEIEHLNVKIGNHATKNGLVLKLEVTTASSQVAGQYNLKFTATGKYASISDFVAALENDSELLFKIEDFKLVPGTDTENLKATFVVKDIAINLNKINKTNSTDQTNTVENNNVNNTNSVNNNTVNTNTTVNQ